MKKFNILELAKKAPPLLQNKPHNPFQGKVKKWLRGIFLFLLIILGLMLAVIGAHQKIYAGRVYPGVHLGTFDLGSLNRAQVQALLTPAISNFEENGLKLSGHSDKGDKEVNLKPILIAVNDPDLSRRIISFDLDATINRAMAVGRQGSIVDRFNQIITSRTNGAFVEAVVQVDRDELLRNIRASFQPLEQTPQNASFELTKDGDLNFVKDRPGYFFDIEGAATKANKNLLILDNAPVVLRLIKQQPQITTEEAEAAAKKAKEILGLAPLTLKFEDQKWTVKKSMLNQWLSLEKIQKVELIFNQDKITAYLNSIGKDINQEALDAKFKMEGERVVEFQPSQPGRQLNLDASVAEIMKQVLANNQEINLIVDLSEPQVPTQDVNDLGIKELIGRGVSNFAGSPKNRRHNIAVGAQKLNGLLIKPNEEFSLVKAIGDINEQAGFLPELVIKGDRTIPEFGGGLCQIGTTTFRAALYSGLPITARTPHSYRVVYYEPAGMDATIYQPQPDLRFINDTGAYILFETKIQGDSLIFEFYGTSDGRKIDITKPTLTNIIQPGEPLYIQTTEISAGQKKQLEMAHAGADAEFTRTTTWPDGKTKTDTWKSHYRPWRAVWQIGVEKIENLPSQPTELLTPDIPLTP